MRSLEWRDGEIRPRMHAYLATVCRDSQCEAYRVGGVADHVHLAVRLSRTISQSELLEKIKKTSSAWIKAQADQCGSFFWQAGYGCFSVGYSQLDELVRYIENRIIERKHFKKNIANYCASIAWTLTSDTCGIEDA